MNRKNKITGGTERPELEFLFLILPKSITQNLHNRCNPPRMVILHLLTLPKTHAHGTGCSQYKILSLISRKLKIFLKILHRKIHQKTEEERRYPVWAQERRNFLI